MVKRKCDLFAILSYFLALFHGRVSNIIKIRKEKQAGMRRPAMNHISHGLFFSLFAQDLALHAKAFEESFDLFYPLV